MVAITDRGLLNQPCTKPGAVNRRLKWAREQEGLSQKDWRERLERDGYTVSKASVSDYEQSMVRSSKTGSHKAVKMPPLDYIARVNKAFGHPLEWLMHGTGELKASDASDHDDAPHSHFESQVFGELATARPAWAPASVGPAVLRILSEAQAALDQDSSEAGLTALRTYLDAVVPSSAQYFLGFAELSRHERQHVVLHVRGLVYLLFRPFKAADRSFVWSQARAGAQSPSQVGPRLGSDAVTEEDDQRLQIDMEVSGKEDEGADEEAVKASDA